MAEAERVDAYLDTVGRLEPDIAPIDTPAVLASIAISLKRIADALTEPNAYGEIGGEAISGAVQRGLINR